MSRVVNIANLKDETAEEKKIISCLLLVYTKNVAYVYNGYVYLDSVGMFIYTACYEGALIF